MEPKDHVVVGKVETDLSWFQNWTSQDYSISLLISSDCVMFTKRLPAHNLQENIFFMARYCPG